MSLMRTLQKLGWNFTTFHGDMEKPKDVTFSIIPGHDAKITLIFRHQFHDFNIVETIQTRPFGEPFRMKNIAIEQHNTHYHLPKERYLMAKAFVAQRYDLFEQMQVLNDFYMHMHEGITFKSRTNPSMVPQPLVDFCRTYAKTTPAHLEQQAEHLHEPNFPTLMSIVLPDYKGAIHHAIYGPRPSF